ncbi:hypothetical protein EWM64_g6116 [Hericium alpestre]|uniref:Elongator complex protein 5 n=1 Tax=Hericium alpestre TaxID=135208 RepID=A0A4Y9ZSW4_9AGAM|nr:hypothetical protein EWM64_g6116 [Hericium alpestre]
MVSYLLLPNSIGAGNSKIQKSRSMFPPEGLPTPGQLLLITDELGSPADFVLHNLLAVHLKDKQNARCVLLSVSESLARWKAIAARSNINLAQKIDEGALVFVDVTTELGRRAPAKSPSSLRPLFDRVQSSIGTSSEDRTLVILDDIATLEWTGHPALVITRFARALVSLCAKNGAALVVRHHVVSAEEPDELFRALRQLCAYHAEVRALASGRSGAVSGEVALHAGASLGGRTGVALIPREQAVQYRLTDSSAVFFQRGTGQAVL